MIALKGHIIIDGYCYPTPEHVAAWIDAYDDGLQQELIRFELEVTL